MGLVHPLGHVLGLGHLGLGHLVHLAHLLVHIVHALHHVERLHHRVAHGLNWVLVVLIIVLPARGSRCLAGPVGDALAEPVFVGLVGIVAFGFVFDEATIFEGVVVKFGDDNAVVLLAL